MWPFKSKPKYSLVTDGENWAVKHKDGGILFVPSPPLLSEWFSPSSALNCQQSWTDKLTAERRLKRLEVEGE